MEFRELAGVSPEILRAVEDMGFSQMTEVQEKAIPVMLSGREIIAKAPTGTGKTCAFGIPLVTKERPLGPVGGPLSHPRAVHPDCGGAAGLGKVQGGAPGGRHLWWTSYEPPD